jgi:hypothetical protein
MKKQDLKFKVAELKDTIVSLKKQLELSKDSFFKITFF